MAITLPSPKVGHWIPVIRHRRTMGEDPAAEVVNEQVAGTRQLETRLPGGGPVPYQRF